MEENNILLMEVYKLLMHECPSSKYLSKLKHCLYIPFCLYTIVYIIEYIILPNKTTITLCYIILSIITVIIVVFVFILSLMYRIKVKYKYINLFLIRKYFHEEDVKYYYRILRENHLLNNLDLIYKYINLIVEEIPYFSFNIGTTIVSILSTVIAYFSDKNIIFILIVFIGSCIIFNPIFTSIIAKLNNKLTKEKAADLKYMKGILLEIEYIIIKNTFYNS